jgi:Fic family protein
VSEPTSDDLLEREERGFAAALVFVLTEAERRWPTLDDALEIHRLIFQEANSSMAGQYRLDIYWPQYTRFAPPGWQLVPGCMLQFGKMMAQAEQECDQLTNEARDEKVIEWVARLHHRLERIHPFQDGNGRAGRALASWMLLYYDLPPFEVTPETRTEYIEALGAADELLRTEDLLHPDYWPHQTAALGQLIDFIVDSLLKEATDEVAARQEEESRVTDTGDLKPVSEDSAGDETR